MAATGFGQGMENRSSMFWRIWLPRPSWKRPPENAERSHADSAVSMGLRTNVNVTAVRTVKVVVCSRARSATASESCTVSAMWSPS